MNFSTNELILLKYLNNAKENNPIPQYFSTKYNIDVDYCIKKFWDCGLIVYSSIYDSLNHYTVQQLKDILSKENLSVPGNKSALITRIVDNMDTSLLQQDLDKYISLSDKGLQLLKDNLSDETYNKRYVLNRHLQSYEERFAKACEDLKKQQKLDKQNMKGVYTITTMNDSAVCDYCSSLKGKKFYIADAVVGVNYPPFKDCKCDFCRCFASYDIEFI